jgi:hypothetical protein
MTTDTAELVKRITGYLACGGLFNPEFANHDITRDLIVDCRDAIQRLKTEKLAEYLRGQMEMREKAGDLIEYRLSITSGRAIATAIRALPIEGVLK